MAEAAPLPTPSNVRVAKLQPTSIVIAISGSDVPVFLLDESAVVIKIKLDTTGAGACASVASHLGLEHDAHYALYEQLDGVFTMVDMDYKLAKMLQRWPQGNAFGGPRRLVFRRFLYMPGSAAELEEERDARSDAQRAHRLCFSDCVYQYRHSRYRFDVDSMLGMAVLLLEATNGPFNRRRDTLERMRMMVVDLCPAYAIADLPLDSPRSYGVSKLADAPTTDEWARRLHRAYAETHGRSAQSAQGSFIAACKANAAYGCEFFAGRQTWEDAQGGRQYADKTVCIGPNGVLLLDMANPLDCHVYEYEDMKEEGGWDVDKTGRIFALQLEDGHSVYVVSEVAVDMLHSLQSFVDFKVSLLVDKVDPTARARPRPAGMHVPSVTGELPPPATPYASSLDIPALFPLTKPIATLPVQPSPALQQPRPIREILPPAPEPTAARAAAAAAVAPAVIQTSKAASQQLQAPAPAAPVFAPATRPAAAAPVPSPAPVNLPAPAPAPTPTPAPIPAPMQAPAVASVAARAPAAAAPPLAVPSAADLEIERLRKAVADQAAQLQQMHELLLATLSRASSSEPADNSGASKTGSARSTASASPQRANDRQPRRRGELPLGWRREREAASGDYYYYYVDGACFFLGHRFCSLLANPFFSLTSPPSFFPQKTALRAPQRGIAPNSPRKMLRPAGRSSTTRRAMPTIGIATPENARGRSREPTSSPWQPQSSPAVPSTGTRRFDSSKRSSHILRSRASSTSNATSSCFSCSGRRSRRTRRGRPPFCLRRRSSRSLSRGFCALRRPPTRSP